MLINDSEKQTIVVTGFLCFKDNKRAMVCVFQNVHQKFCQKLFT